MCFVGRKDRQVKVRGLRIELEDIEVNAISIDGVKEAFADVQHGLDGSPKIVLYYRSDLINNEIKDLLAKTLPSKMVPDIAIHMESFPLNANGKIDKKQLPSIHSATIPENIVLPVNDTEEILLKMWKDILCIDNVSCTMSFFEAGGTSLTLSKLITRIHKQFNKKVSIKELYIDSSIQNIARILETKHTSDVEEIKRIKPAESYPVSYAQNRMFLLEQINPGSSLYTISGLYDLNGELDLSAFKEAIECLIQRYEILRTNFFMSNDDVSQTINENVYFTIDTKKSNTFGK